MKSNSNLKHWILCIHFIAFIWLLVTCRCEITETSSGCPSFCNCSTLSINCSSSDLIELPNINYTDVRYVTSLIINNTSIRRIRARSFIYYPELVVLNITSSLIEVIETDAFCGLSHLTNLSLEANRLQVIESGSFNCLKSLKQLTLRSNALTHIQPKAFCMLQNLQHLILDNNRLKSMSEGDFGCLLNLESLRLKHNAISTIETNSLCGLESLVRLNLKGNRLKVVKNESLACLSSLEDIYLEYNVIEDIEPNSFRNLTKLRMLDIAGNHLKIVRRSAFVGLPSVEHLKLEQNSITYVEPYSFCGMPKVWELQLFQNKIKKLERYTFACTSNLRNISIHNNDIEFIEIETFCSMPYLEKLDLNDNKLPKLSNGSLACLSRLTELSVISNQITNIDEDTFKPTNKLAKLFLTDNSLSIIKPSYFVNLDNLYLLELADNKIRIIENGSFTKLKNLVFLSLSGNDLTHIQRDHVNGLTNLQEFRASLNKLVSIEDGTFCDFRHLETLRLDRNKLSHVHPQTLCAPSLLRVYLNSNNIDSVAPTTFQNLTSIEILVMNNNNISNLPTKLFKSMKVTLTLTIINVRLNSLDAYQFSGLISLRHLRLAFNNISSINDTAFEDLYNLTTLDLTDNKLKRFSSTIFSPLVNLQDLNLNENEIPRLNAGQFKHLINLKALRLQTNAISHIDENTFTGLNKLQLLQLSGNPIRNFPEFQLPNVASMEFLGLSRSYPLRLNVHNGSVERSRNSTVIKTLDLTNNYISEIRYLDFADCRTLNLSYNKLHESNPLNFSTLLNLAHLDLTSNRYSNIKSVKDSFIMSNYSNLQSLNISSNMLSNIDTKALEPLSELQSLILQNNKLQKLDFIGKLSQLVILSLASNRIHRVNSNDFKNLRSLEELYLDDNLISTLSENYFMNTKLTFLYLQNNQISNVNPILKGLQNLRILNLNANRIEKVTEIFNITLPYLSQLYLSNNGIESLQNKPFSRYRNLRILDLSDNEIKLSVQDDLGLTFLEKLDLAKNKISNLTCSGLPPVLRSLILAHNNIKRFDPDCDGLFFQINKIDMSYTRLIANGIDMKKDFLDKLNLINDLKLAGNEWNADIKEMVAITNLKLDVSENPITLDTLMKDLSDLVGPFLVGIHLNKCNISSIPQKAFAFDSLRILSLDGNSICEFDMVDISSRDENILTDLSLSNNKLEKIYSSLSIRYGNLKKLNISGNIIEELCYQAIAKLFPNVREIDASRNKISTLQERCFRGLSSLQKLDLRKNWLGEVSRESFYGPSKLVEILTNRPYFCCIIPAKILSCKPSMISDTLSSCQHLLAHISLQFFIWLVGILAFLGNIFVIVRNLRIIRAKKKNKADKVNLFLINNLAISDFIMSIYLFIIGFANLVYSNQGLYGIRSEKWLRHPLCAVSCTLMTTSSIVSVFLMVVISIDRFITIVYALEGKKLSRFYSRLIIGIIWLGGFTFALIPSLFSINQPGNKRLYTFNSMCMPSNYENPDYRVWMIAYIVSTIIAWIITCSLYIRLFIYIRDTGKAVTQATNRKAKARKDKIIALRLFIILITDLISWVPYYIVNIAGFASSDGVDVITLQFIGIFALPINSALNPYLYTLTSAAVIKGLFIRPATGATYTIRKKRITKRRKQIKLEKNMDDLDHHHEKSNADKECSNTQLTFTF